MLNKSRICNEIRKRYPKFLGIRKGLQKIKVSRLTRHVLPKELIEKGEADPKAIPEIIAPLQGEMEQIPPAGYEGDRCHPEEVSEFQPPERRGKGSPDERHAILSAGLRLFPFGIYWFSF